MKKNFTLIIAFMALALPMIAQESDSSSSSKPIILSTHPRDNEPNPIIPRAPMRVEVEAMMEGRYIPMTS